MAFHTYLDKHFIFRFSYFILLRTTLSLKQLRFQERGVAVFLSWKFLNKAPRAEQRVVDSCQHSVIAKWSWDELIPSLIINVLPSINELKLFIQIKQQLKTNSKVSAFFFLGARCLSNTPHPSPGGVVLSPRSTMQVGQHHLKDWSNECACQYEYWKENKKKVCRLTCWQTNGPT